MCNHLRRHRVQSGVVRRHAFKPPPPRDFLLHDRRDWVIAPFRFCVSAVASIAVNANMPIADRLSRAPNALPKRRSQTKAHVATAPTVRATPASQEAPYGKKHITSLLHGTSGIFTFCQHLRVLPSRKRPRFPVAIAETPRTVFPEFLSVRRVSLFHLMGIVLRFDGHRLEIRWASFGNSMGIVWKFDGHRFEIRWASF